MPDRPRIRRDCLSRSGRNPRLGRRVARAGHNRQAKGLAGHALAGTSSSLALWFRARLTPALVSNCRVIDCRVALLWAVGMGYVRYFLGAGEKQKNLNLAMYAGTGQVLLPRGDNPWRQSAPEHVPPGNPYLVSCHFRLAADSSLQVNLDSSPQSDGPLRSQLSTLSSGHRLLKRQLPAHRLPG